MQIEAIQTKIYEIRGLKVMLDYDLAELYEVQTKNLNLAVKRNLKRFPYDFMFQLSANEWESLRLQIETSKGRGGTRYLPYAFTHKDLTAKLHELESKYDTQFKDVYDAISYLLDKDKTDTNQKQRKRIGYKPD